MFEGKELVTISKKLVLSGFNLSLPGIVGYLSMLLLFYLYLSIFFFCRLMIEKSTFSKNYFRNTIRVLNSLAQNKHHIGIVLIK